MANRYDTTLPVADQLRAVRDDSLMPTPDKQDTAYAVLTRGADTVADLLEALRLLKEELTIPAAEYVPAIPACWDIIGAAIAKATGSSDFHITERRA